MTQQAKATSPILAAVHETATDLHANGLIDRRRMRAYDALCLAPVSYTHLDVYKRQGVHTLWIKLFPGSAKLN